jgi:hypothetical protein
VRVTCLRGISIYANGALDGRADKGKPHQFCSYFILQIV